jgi:hypothetical protein
MKPLKFLVIIGLILALIGVWFFTQKNTTSEIVPNESQNQTGFDGKNAQFTIEGESVQLTNGVSERALSSGATKITTRYFGNEAKGDLNFDGREDMAFLITQDNGGSGTFYYVVVALKTDTGYTTTNGFFIGDRIAPQTTEIKSQIGELHVNYADRNPGEPMTATPTRGSVKLLKVTKQGVLEGLMK